MDVEGGEEQASCADSSSTTSDTRPRRRRRYPCLCYVWVGCSAFILVTLMVAIVTLEIIYFTTDDHDDNSGHSTQIHYWTPSPTLVNDYNPSWTYDSGERSSHSEESHETDYYYSGGGFSGESSPPNSAAENWEDDEEDDYLQNIITWLIVALFLVGLVLIIFTVFVAKGWCPNKKFSSFDTCLICVAQNEEQQTPRHSQNTEEINIEQIRSHDPQRTNHNRQDGGSATNSRQELSVSETQFQAPPPYNIALTFPLPDIHIMTDTPPGTPPVNPARTYSTQSAPIQSASLQSAPTQQASAQPATRQSSLPSYEEATAAGNAGENCDNRAQSSPEVTANADTNNTNRDTNVDTALVNEVTTRTVQNGSSLRAMDSSPNTAVT